MCFASARTAERTAERDTVPSLAESCTTRRAGRELSRAEMGAGSPAPNLEPVDLLAGVMDAVFADVIVKTAIVGLRGVTVHPI